MRYLSVCSGIEAASVAWTPLGWSPVAFSEIEPFPCAVLTHHYPNVPNWGDMTKFTDWPDATTVDLLCGGTPCQSFSVAGLRKGLDDPRGNLMLTFGAIAARYRPRWLVWENVPGVLSSNKGRDFGAFLGLLGILGYGFAYRVLDAQYFGLAQRRKRVFVVGCLGDWRRAAAVLFERQSLSGHPAPSREARQVAPTIPARSLGGGGLGTDFDCDGGLIAQHPCVTVAFHPTQDTISSTDGSTHALCCGSTGGQASVAVAVALRGREGGATAELGDEVQNCLRASSGGGDKPHVLTAMQVRRLTPRECERLMGFPDDYTLVPLPLKGRQTRVRWASDSARYKALGNSWAVPVVRWIGERINAVEQIKHERKAA